MVAWVLGTARERELIRAVVVGSVAALILTFLGGDLGRDILIVDLQPWRILWLLSLFANLLSGVAVLRIPKGWISRELFLALFVVSFMADLLGFLPWVLAGVTLLPCVAFAWERRSGHTLPKAVNLALIAFPMSAFWLEVYFIYWQRGQETFALTMIGGGLGLAVLILLLVSLTSRPHSWLLAITPIVGIAAAATVDHRKGWQKMVENDKPPPGVSQFLAGSQAIYWEGDDGLPLIWLNLKAPSYYSCMQGAGLVFYRGTAMEWNGKSAILRKLYAEDAGTRANCADRKLLAQRPDTRDSIAEVCRSLPDLGSLVLIHPVIGVDSQQWTAPESIDFRNEGGKLEHINTYYKFSCPEFRQNDSYRK